MAKKKKTSKTNDNAPEPGIFRRARIDGAPLGAPGEILTFRNIVIAMGAATLLIFLGAVGAGRTAVVVAAMAGLSGLVLFEMSSRRKWETQLLGQLRKMAEDYDRLVREAARNRNDLAVLKKGLSTAGSLARSYGDLSSGDGSDLPQVEQRMVKAIAEHLSKIGDVPEDAKDEDILPDAAALLVGKDEDEVGRRLTDAQVLQLVQAAVKQDRIDMFLQPVVALPQRKLRFYEMFGRIRIRTGIYLPAERYIEVALRQELMPVIDNLLLLRGLQLLRDTGEQNLNHAYFCNITSITLNDPKFMGDLVEFIAQNRALAPRLIFELGQKELATMNAETLPVLDGLARLGCRFSMDRARSLSFDYAFLEARHIRFIRVEASLLVNALKEPGGFHRLKRLKSELDSQGIDLIVEKIETERQLLTLLDLEIDYGQGYLFGKPELSVAA